MSDNLLGKAVDQAGGVLEKAYNDLAHPTAKSLGNTVSLLPHTVGIWLQANDDMQGKLNDVMMSIMAHFQEKAMEDGE